MCEALLLPRPCTFAVSSGSSAAHAWDIRYTCQRLQLMEQAAQQVHLAKQHQVWVLGLASTLMGTAWGSQLGICTLVCCCNASSMGGMPWNRFRRGAMESAELPSAQQSLQT